MADQSGSHPVAAEISRVFGCACVVRELVRSEIGANLSRHYILRAQDGNVYSIKCSKAGGAGAGSRNEYLANKLAQTVGIRGASLARRVAPLPSLGSEFVGTDVVAVRWGLPNSKRLGESRDAISLQREPFLQQLGCWAVFSSMIGAGDRNSGNLVWDVETATLAHIDFEDSFRGNENYQEQVQYAKEYGGLSGAAWKENSKDPLGTALAAGILEGTKLLLDGRNALLEAMRAEGLDDPIVAKAQGWIDAPFQEKLARFQTSVG